MCRSLACGWNVGKVEGEEPSDALHAGCEAPAEGAGTPWLGCWCVPARPSEPDHSSFDEAELEIEDDGEPPF